MAIQFGGVLLVFEFQCCFTQLFYYVMWSIMIGNKESLTAKPSQAKPNRAKLIECVFRNPYRMLRFFFWSAV